MNFQKLIWHSMRDENGTLLKYKSIMNTKFITDEIFKLIQSLETYKSIEHKFNKELFDIFIKKKLFEKIIHISTQMEIIKYEIGINKSKKKYLINLCGLNFQYLRKKIKAELKKIDNFNEKQLIITNTKLINKKNFLKTTYFNFLNIIEKSSLLENIYFKIYNLIEFLKISYFQFNINIPSENNKILIKYGEGLDQNKRSDLFWINDDFEKKDILIFFPTNKTFISIFKTIKKIKDKNYNICLFPQYKKKNLFNKLKFKFKKNNFNNLDLWLYKKTKSFYGQLENNISFFKKYKTKILFDPYEFGTHGVIHYQASEILNFCTVGKMRSYHSEIPGKLFYAHMHDIHILWGKHSLKRYLNQVNSGNYFKSKLFILNGYSHSSNSQNIEHKEKIKAIKKKFNNYLVRKTILLLDNTIGDHEWPRNNTQQVISINSAKIYYDYFISILQKYNHLGIIIKSKNNKSLEDLLSNNNKYKKLLTSGRLIVVPDSKGVPSSDYSSLADIVIGINADDIPSAVIECLINCKRSIFYDYSNLIKYEKEIYKIGANKFVFNDFENLQSKLEDFIINDDKNDFGNWDNIIDDIFAFKDYEGSKRVSRLVKNLFNNLKYNNKNESIKKTANYYGSNYGEEKIFKTI